MKYICRFFTLQRTQLTRNMNTVSNQPTYEPEPVEAVECSYTNAVYKIKYINIHADEDGDGELDQQKIIRLYEVVDKPPRVCSCSNDELTDEWGNDDSEHNVIPTYACCSKGFVEFVLKEIEHNNTGFPTMIYFGRKQTWIILEVTKIM